MAIYGLVVWMDGLVVAMDGLVNHMDFQKSSKS